MIIPTIRNPFLIVLKKGFRHIQNLDIQSVKLSKSILPLLQDDVGFELGFEDSFAGFDFVYS